MSDDKGPVTVADLFGVAAAARLQRTLTQLTEQQSVMARLFPPPVLTRRQQLVRRARGRRDAWREAVAVKIAPWLDRH